MLGEILVVVVVALCAIYGAHVVFTRVLQPVWRAVRRKPEGAIVPALAFLALGLGLPSESVAAQTTAPTLTFDLSPFFDNLNTYLPIFIGLFGVVGGIAGAMALARYVIGAVVNAFSGKSI